MDLVRLRTRVDKLLELCAEAVPPPDTGHPMQCHCDACEDVRRRTPEALQAMASVAHHSPTVLREVLELIDGVEALGKKPVQ